MKVLAILYLICWVQSKSLLSAALRKKLGKIDLAKSGVKKKHRKLMMPGGAPDFPPLPLPDEMPIIINSPPVELPKMFSTYSKTGHVIFAPTMIYPKKKKQIIVHHGVSMTDQYRQMISRMNPNWLEMAENNPYYANMFANNQAYQSLTTSPDYLKY